MFRLKKLYPPFGTKDAPVIEASYAEGTVEVVDGLCEVKLPETRDRLLKMGYAELPADAPAKPNGKEKKRR
ncbi:MAG: hypothetical protein NTX59_02740 [Elusimicrobia bacterium]|nr:hypothetical protein [Elusimicrobiota bacterium]